jgi:YfiH family protein
VAVAENRRLASAAVLPEAHLVTCYQVHSATCVEADVWADEARPHADALVTNRKGLVLGILTADCAPVLFADLEAGVVGAAHAGWKGAFGGVCEATVAAMEKLGAARGRIVAAVGPCIAQASYEVDDAFRARIMGDPVGSDDFFVEGSRAGHWQFDLQAYVMDCLWYRAGVARVEGLDLDTYADPSRFYSFRRATHAQEPDYGRQIALIGLG